MVLQRWDPLFDFRRAMNRHVRATRLARMDLDRSDNGRKTRCGHLDLMEAGRQIERGARLTLAVRKNDGTGGKTFDNHRASGKSSALSRERRPDDSAGRNLECFGHVDEPFG